MAIAFDVASSASGSPSATPLEWAHTCTGANGLLLVGVQCQDNTVSGVTYNGVAMTLLDSDLVNSTVSMFGLKAPATGANTVSIAYTGSKYIRGIASSYTGFLGTLPDSTNTFTNAAGSPTSSTITITTVDDNCWAAVMVYAANVATAITAGTGGTLRATEQANTMFMDSNGVITPAGGYDMTADYNANSTTEQVLVGVSFSPTAAAAGGAIRYNRTLLGVGQ